MEDKEKVSLKKEYKIKEDNIEKMRVFLKKENLNDKNK